MSNMGSYMLTYMYRRFDKTKFRFSSNLEFSIFIFQLYYFYMNVSFANGHLFTGNEHVTPLHVLFFHLNVDGRSEWLITPKKNKIERVWVLHSMCLFTCKSLDDHFYTCREHSLLANHKAHRVLVKLHVFQIPRDKSLLVKIGQQWPAM